MPLQNRVTPFGEIVAIAQRGMFMGNRGIIHDPRTPDIAATTMDDKGVDHVRARYSGRSTRRDERAQLDRNSSSSMNRRRSPPDTGRPAFLPSRSGGEVPAARMDGRQWRRSSVRARD